MARRKKGQNFGWKGQVLLIGAMITSVLFSAVSIILIIGMVPTIVCGIVDRTKGKIKTLTIGALNFAGCVPFVMEVFLRGNNIETAINYIIQPRTIVVMYFAAGIGYLIDWSMTGIVSKIMVQKHKKRLIKIEEDQKKLSGRWGLEVSGTIPLDEQGFPKDMQGQKRSEPS
jgi:hypothetical protein